MADRAGELVGLGAPQLNPVEVLGVVPTGGTELDPDEAVQFDVRSLSEISRIIISFTFDGYTFREVAFENDPTPPAPAVPAFEEVYAGSSTIETISDGAYFRFRFVVIRNLAWPGSPELSVVAFTRDGTEA
jgi:hypothetical protein